MRDVPGGEGQQEYGRPRDVRLRLGEPEQVRTPALRAVDRRGPVVAEPCQGPGDVLLRRIEPVGCDRGGEGGSRRASGWRREIDGSYFPTAPGCASSGSARATLGEGSASAQPSPITSTLARQASATVRPR